MKYQGSKRRLAKDIIPILIKDRKPGQYFVEPFCGSCSIIQELENPRIAADSNYYLVELLKWVQKGWVPPDIITEEEYIQCKNRFIANCIFNKENRFSQNLNDNIIDAYIGFVGFCCSYGGKLWGGYARGNTNKGQPRNYCLEQKKNIIKQAPKLAGIDFKWCDYKDLEIPPNSILYLDPPYENTTRYKMQSKFNHQDFWEWVRLKVKEGYQVFISEYTAPSDFTCVWQKEIVSSLTKDTGSKTGVEKLFIYKG